MRGEPTFCDCMREVEFAGYWTWVFFEKTLYVLGTDTLHAIAGRRPGGRNSPEVIELVRAWMRLAEAVNAERELVSPERRSEVGPVLMKARAERAERQVEAIAAKDTCREWLKRIMAQPPAEIRHETEMEKKLARILHAKAALPGVIWLGLETYCALVTDSASEQAVLADALMSSIDVTALAKREERA